MWTWCVQFLQLVAFFIIAKLMEKKANECKHWKLRAQKAESELKLIRSILTLSQLEELRRQNVDIPCDEPLQQADAGADSSLESCQAVRKSHNSDSYLACVTEFKGQCKVSREHYKCLDCVITANDYTVMPDYMPLLSFLLLSFQHWLQTTCLCSAAVSSFLAIVHTGSYWLTTNTLKTP